MEFIDLKAQYQALKPEIDKGIEAVLAHGQFIMGKEVGELETALATAVGVKHCISCANGTDALQLLYMAYEIGEGDAVFCPDITFISSVEPAAMLGATPVFCDITPDSYNICPSSLRRQIKAVLAEGKLKPRAVVAVDFLGNPCDFDTLQDICKEYGLVLFEDAAQSFGASYHGRKTCSFGDAATTSFFPAKPLGCYGDGGAVFTNDDHIAAVCRSLRIHGKGPKGKYDNVRIGLNSRLDTLQAAILLPKLKALLDFEVQKRQTVAAGYNYAFDDYFVTPYVAKNCVSVYAQYALLAKNQEQRDKIIAHLNEKKIPNMIYYPTPQHELPVFSDYCTYGESYPVAKAYAATTFALPMHPYLEMEEQEKVIHAVLEGAK